MKMRKRILVSLLSAVMVVSSLQMSTATVLAEENSGVTQDSTALPEEAEKEENESTEGSESVTVSDGEESFVPAEEGGG